MLEAYIVAALWSSTGDDSEPLDAVYSAEDIAEEAREQMQRACQDFLAYCDELGIDHDALSAEQMGHDFWLTRNGHGAGFWDRGLGELGDKLSDAAKTFGTSDLYVGDDGRIYCM